jgi:acyl phosphate:glycerol-3-phosphate acyltransferase
MNAIVATAIAIVLAYLLGSIPFAILVSRIAGIADPRSFGSGNPGATNVLRSGNKGAAAATLFLDALKGWLAVWLASTFGWRFGIDDTGVALVALAVFIGHLYPVFFKFKGGKGVATALGILIALEWWLGFATAMTWVVIVFFTRYSSLAALVAAVFAPFYYALLVGLDVFTGAITIMSALIIYRHRRNIANLIAGKEGRVGTKNDVKRGASRPSRAHR